MPLNLLSMRKELPVFFCAGDEDLASEKAREK